MSSFGYCHWQLDSKMIRQINARLRELRRKQYILVRVQMIKYVEDGDWGRFKSMLMVFYVDEKYKLSIILI